MTTATKTFTTAIRVHRSNAGCYEFASTRTEWFADVVSHQAGLGRSWRQFDWTIVEELTGWGGWTHAVRVTYGDENVYYFAR